MLVEGRLTTESGVPVSTADRTAQSTIYFALYKGNRVRLYDGANWNLHTFTERSLALSGLTSGKNYDVFLFDNTGTLTLELSAAWTDDTTRADAITLQDGVYVKSGATTRLYLGTIRTTGTTTTEDSLAKRFVWNMYNRTQRAMKGPTETTDSWNYTTATFRQANANTANQLDYVVGMPDVLIEADVNGGVLNVGSIAVTVGIGVDSTSANSAINFGRTTTSSTTVHPVRAVYKGYPGVGRHFIAWLEYSQASGTTTWYGDAGVPTVIQTGIIGSLMN